jgi:hypothetical protein
MEEFNISHLASEISNINNYLHNRTLQQVNTSLSIRNWLAGLYIVEYEQNGSDRAKYGAGAISELAALLRHRNVKGLDERTLRTCRAFYLTYPQIWRTLSSILQLTKNEDNTKWGAVSPIFNSLIVSGKLEDNPTVEELKLLLAIDRQKFPDQ